MINSRAFTKWNQYSIDQPFWFFDLLCSSFFCNNFNFPIQCITFSINHNFLTRNNKTIPSYQTDDFTCISGCQLKLIWRLFLSLLIGFIPPLSGQNAFGKNLAIPLHIAYCSRNAYKLGNWVSISNKKNVDISSNFDELYISCHGNNSENIQGTLLPFVKEKNNFNIHIILHLNPEKKTCYGLSVYPVNTTFDSNTFSGQVKFLMKDKDSFNKTLFITLRNEGSVSFTGPNFPEKINFIKEDFNTESTILPSYVTKHFQKSFLRKYWMVVLGLFVLMLILPTQQDVSS
ncbi:uncharacterized protein LOC128882541 [Hylaeus volcanicus]|uniref:uncharacterized protein LOC128882541 n=1 Tax=Hylaeus volcanicus TaxID=313075 RepID=UPI0023B77E26|nr:uncharacterized protein LOC128882541 [Hylaeus volcanicus]